MDFFKHKYFFLFVFSLLFCTLLWADNALAQKDVSIPNPPAIEQKAESVLPQDIPNDTEIKKIVLNGTPAELKALLNKKINVNSDEKCLSMLNMAIQSLILSENDELKPETAIEKIKILVNAGADVNKETCKMTPLAIAVTIPEQGRQLEKKFMAVLNANINSPRGICIVNGVDKPCSQTTSQERVKMREELHNTFSEELKKIEIYLVEILRFLIDSGADINKPSHMVAPLLFAANTPEEGGTTILRFLLDNGANPNIRDFQGNTPLFVANFAKNTDAINLLINAGADTSIRNMNGQLYNEYKTGEYYNYF